MDDLKLQYDGKYYGVVNKSNTIVVPFIYDEILRTFSSGLINVCKNDKWGCLDLNGNVVIPLEYDWIVPFDKKTSGISSAKRNGKWGLINKNGTIVEPFVHNEEILFSNNFASLTRNGENLIISRDGQIFYGKIKNEKSVGHEGIIIVNKQGKYGLMNHVGEMVIPFEYDEIVKDNTKRCFVVTQNKKNGLVSFEGMLLIPLEYDGIGDGSRSTFAAKLDGYWGVISEDNHVVLPFEYDEIKFLAGKGFLCIKQHPYKEMLLELGNSQKKEIKGIKAPNIFYDSNFKILKCSKSFYIIQKKEGLCGLMDKQQNMISACEYNNLYILSSKKEILAAQKREKWGIIDNKGKIIAPFVYDKIGQYYSDLHIIEVYQNKLLGLIRDNGTTIQPCSYDIIIDIVGERASFILLYIKDYSDWIILKKKGYYGILKSDTFEEVMPFEYNFIRPINPKGIIIIQRNGKWGLANKDFQIIIPTEYDTIEECADNKYHLLKKEKGSWIYINNKGDISDLSKYSEINDFSDGLALVKCKNRFGYVNDNWNEIIPCVYDEADPFECGVAIVRIGNKFGVIGKGGETIIPFEYDLLGLFSILGPPEILAVKEKKCGVLSVKNKVIVPFEYDEVLPMFGMITVTKQGKKGVFNHKGQLIVPVEYDDIQHPSKEDTSINVCRKERWGVLNKNGQVICEPRYDLIDKYGFACGRLAVCRDGKWGFIDRKGNEVIECKYDEIIQFFEDKRCQVKLNGKKITININGERIF